MSQNREFDVVVYGATGFTGALVADYLAVRGKQYPNLRWAIAGRDTKKLEQLQDRLKASGCNVAYIVADSSDEKAVAALTKRTKVVATTVGPYALYGSKLVEACVDNGTDYCDLTGEPVWVRGVIDRHHEKARKDKTLIVNMCGFDSIPSDMGVFALHQYARDKLNSHLLWTKAIVDVSGHVSGGTVSSMMTTFRLPAAAKALLRNPYLLEPSATSEYRSPLEKQQILPYYDKDLKAWTAPWIMATVNSRVVRRSHGLTKEENKTGYGPTFGYFETMKVANVCVGATITGGLAMLVAMGSIPFTRENLLARLIPKPGDGPTEEQRKASHFRMSMVAETNKGRRLHSVMSGGCAGYGETSKMLAECALAMALDRRELPCQGGCVTPSVAFGNVLLRRLSDVGLGIKVEEDVAQN